MVKFSVVICFALLVIGCIADEAAAPKSGESLTEEFDQQVNVDPDEPVKTKKKLPEIKIEVVSLPSNGCERKTQRLDVLSMKYTGYLENGTKFESTSDHNQEFQFQLGVGQVIQGWEKGLLDMCVGEKRKLTIPPHLAYGSIGAGEKIPPNSVLIFDCELTKIDDGPKPANVFKQIDTDGNGELTTEEVSAFLVKTSEESGERIEPDSDEHKDVLKNVFAHEDKNKDGVISFAEFSGPKHDEL